MDHYHRQHKNTIASFAYTHGERPRAIYMITAQQLQ
jgi:hypothetical protein